MTLQRQLRHSILLLVRSITYYTDIKYNVYQTSDSIQPDRVAVFRIKAKKAATE